MNTKYEQSIKVLSSRVGTDLKLGILDALNLLQDNMCEYFEKIGCDGVTMVPKAGCFFAITKTKLKIFSSPRWLDRITLSTDICKLTAVRLNLINTIAKGDEMCVSSIQEMCAMDINTRKLRTIETTLLPKDISVYEIEDSGFNKIDDNFNDYDLVGTAVIKPTNIDFYHHTNNVEYVRIVLDSFQLEEIESMNITDFEIHYLNESRCGEVLEIYRTQIDCGYIVKLMCNNKTIVKCLITTSF